MTNTGIACTEALIRAQFGSTDRVEERLGKSFGGGADGDMTVHRPIDAERRKPRYSLTRTLRHSAAFEEIEGFACDHRCHYAEHGNINVLPESGALRLMQSSQQT